MDQQPEPTLVEFIRYNNWANAQVIAICRGLAAEQLAAAAPGAYGSIHATLGHMIAAEADYVGRLTGQPLEPPFQWADRPSIDAIADFAQQVAAALLDTVQRIPPTAMVHEAENGFTVDYRAWGLLMQAVIHGVEHRTNVTTILNSLGVALPELDSWGYMVAHPERSGWQEGGQSQR
jgi:uncharacterized damage-inducible protein DinB